jgi:rubrerythrin
LRHLPKSASRALQRRTSLPGDFHAFAGESQANRKYLAFAQKAERDGFPVVARLFRAAAEAEAIHAQGHLVAMGAIGTTAENLEAAIQGETYEYQEMYPPMKQQADAEGHRARTMFGWALGAEEVHARLYHLALEAVKAGKDLEAVGVYLCPVCGHLELAEPTAKCPICGAPASKYQKY